MYNGQSFVKDKCTWFLLDAKTSERYEVNKRSITVKLKGGALKEELKKLNESQNVKFERENILGFIDLILPEYSDCFKIYDIYEKSGLFELVEINAFGKSLSNDTFYSRQYHLNHSSQPDINAPEAWGMVSSHGNGIVIAVIDEGVFLDHPDIIANKNSNVGWDFIPPEDNNPQPPQSSAEDHGTHVGGIAAASTNNGIGVAGVAGGWGNSGAKIMSLRLIKTVEVGGVPVATLFSQYVDDAILYAVLNGADIINMSFSSPDLSAIRSALDFAYNTRGLLLVAAGGNLANHTSLEFPARDKNVMAVAGMKWDWTHYGNKGYELEIAAPALSIFSTTFTEQIDGKYGYKSGTSMASPQVSGAAALIWSNFPYLINFDIRRIIKETGYINFSEYSSFTHGEGLLKLDEAVDYAYNLPSKPTGVTISAPIGGNPTISWNSIQGAINYGIYRAEDERLDLMRVATTTNTSWTDNSIGVQNPRWADHTYYYRVTNDYGYDESAVSDEVSCGGVQLVKGIY